MTNVFEDQPENENPQKKSGFPNVLLAGLVAALIAIFWLGWRFVSEPTSPTESLTVTVDSLNSLKKDTTTLLLANKDSVLTNSVAEVPPPKITKEFSEENHQEEKISTKSKKTKKKKTESEDSEKTTPKAFMSYHVEKGETFYGIAKKFNISKTTLEQNNPNIMPEKIKEGSNLKIPVKSVHVIKKGDYLRVVAEKYGVSKELIMTINKKKKDNTQVGEVLYIPFPEKN